MLSLITFQNKVILKLSSMNKVISLRQCREFLILYEKDSDQVIGLVGENGSGKHFTMMGTDPTTIKEMAEKAND